MDDMRDDNPAHARNGGFAMRFNVMPGLFVLLAIPVAGAEPLSPLDRLDVKTIPDTRQFSNQPRELVAVLGEPLTPDTDTHYPFRVAIRSDGRMIAACSRDNTVRLWVLEGEEPKGHGLAVTQHPKYRIVPIAVKFSPDGSTLAVSSYGMDFWDLTGPQPKKRAAGKETAFFAYAVAFAPEGQAVLTGGRDGVSGGGT
jgi:WD40 repeat protein